MQTNLTLLTIDILLGDPLSLAGRRWHLSSRGNSSGQVDYAKAIASLTSLVIGHAFVRRFRLTPYRPKGDIPDFEAEIPRILLPTWKTTTEL